MRQLLSDIALIPDANRRGETFERVVKIESVLDTWIKESS